MSLKTIAIVFFTLYIWIVCVMVFNLKSSTTSKPSPSNIIFTNDINENAQDDEIDMNIFADDSELPCDYDDISQIQKCTFDLSDTRWRTIEDKVFMLPPAYYDDRKSGDPYIRILALLAGRPATKFHASTLPNLQCRIPICRGAVKLVPAIIYPFNENMGKRYGGYIVSCPLKGFEEYVRHTCDVTLSVDTSEEELQSVTVPLMTWERPKVKNEGQKEKESKVQGQSGIAVCVPPLYGSKMEPERLVEFIELHGMLGVEHFFFYNYTGDNKASNFNANTNDILEYYSQQGTATVYQWSLPVSKGSVRYYGQLTTVHHCLYSSMYRYKYVAFVDIDEFLLPRKSVTWPEMLAEVDDDTHCGFRFLSSFFRPPPDIRWTNPLTLTWTSRAVGVHSKRSKCIVRPERMFEMGVHHMSKWIDEQWTPTTVDYSLAQVQHYRTCVPDLDPTIDCDLFEVDETALKYSGELIDRYSHAYRSIFGSDGLTEHEAYNDIIVNRPLTKYEERLKKMGMESEWYRHFVGLVDSRGDDRKFADLE